MDNFNPNKESQQERCGAGAPTANKEKSCEHCFCQQMSVNGAPHLVCCNCGLKKALNPPSWGFGLGGSR